MPLQNFVPLGPPAVSATWLNEVDRLKFTVFGDAATKIAARQQWQLSIVNLGVISGTHPGNYVAPLPFDGWVYDNGTLLSFTPNFGNTDPATLNVGGLGVLPIVRPGGAPTQSGDLPVNVPVIVAFDNNADALILISSTVVSPVGMQNAVLAAGDNNDVPVNANVAFLECDTTAGAANITGLAAQPNGSFLTVTNTGANPLVLAALSGLSLAANRLRLSADVMLLTNDSFTFRYSSDIGLWVSIS